MDLSFTVAILNTLICAAVSYTAWYKMYSIKTMFAGIGEKLRGQDGLQALDDLHVPQEWKTVYSEEFFDRTDEWLAYGVQILPFLFAKISKRLVEISLMVVLVFVAIIQDLPDEFNTGALMVEWPDLILAVASIITSFVWPRYYLLSKTEKTFLGSIVNIYDCYYYGNLVPAMEKVNQANEIFFQDCRRAYLNVAAGKEKGDIDEVQDQAKRVMREKNAEKA